MGNAQTDPEDDRRAYYDVVEHDPRDRLLELNKELDYDPEGNSDLDALIAYEDALEDLLRATLDEIAQLEVWVLDVSGTGDRLYVFLDEAQAHLFSARRSEATVTCEPAIGQTAGARLIADGHKDAE
jgi:hypothetical protein